MFPYKYTIIDISEEKEKGYKAIIPAFPNLYIVADSVKELDQTVKQMINEEIEQLNKQKKTIPLADNTENYSGTFTVRINPILHKRISDLAQANDISTNKFIENLLSKNIATQ